jgi:hypothetical protein
MPAVLDTTFKVDERFAGKFDNALHHKCVAFLRNVI